EIDGLATYRSRSQMVHCEMGGGRSGHCGFDRGSSDRERPMTQRPWLPVEQKEREHRSWHCGFGSDMMQGVAEDEEEEVTSAGERGGG
ncbi:hypothetical protein GW17_00022813, partial [Ensete ventricosum]